jgi:hypothetical protein
MSLLSSHRARTHPPQRHPRHQTRFSAPTGWGECPGRSLESYLGKGSGNVSSLNWSRPGHQVQNVGKLSSRADRDQCTITFAVNCCQVPVNRQPPRLGPDAFCGPTPRAAHWGRLNDRRD